MAGLDEDFLGEAWAAKGTKIGYLPQEPELDPELDVRGNVDEAARATRKGPRAQKLSALRKFTSYL